MVRGFRQGELATSTRLKDQKAVGYYHKTILMKPTVTFKAESKAISKY